MKDTVTIVGVHVSRHLQSLFAIGHNAVAGFHLFEDLARGRIARLFSRSR